MDHKPYRIVTRKVSVYLDSLEQARTTARDYLEKHMPKEPVVIEKLNRDMVRSRKYMLAYCYQDFEAWVLDTRTMRVKKLVLAR